MDSCLKRSALLLSTALGLLLLPGAQAMAQTATGAPTAAAVPASAGPQAGDQAGAAATVGEVLVTAEKREETSLNVPMGLTALSGNQLVRQQAFRLEDFVGQVPGLNLTDTLGGSQLVVRGIAASSTSVNAPVATYIDETPLVGVGPFSGGSSTTPNIDTFDMARVEVLKGPQGTLYGADALGGILKYVTNAPDPSGFHATAQGGASSVANGGAGFDLHGMINVPLASDLALRVVGYDNSDPGFINDPSRGVNGINGNRFYGGHAALLWTPTANFSIRLNALYQTHTWGDLGAEDVNSGSFTPIYCNLCQERYAPQPGNNKLQYYNGTINWDLGWAKLLSSTTYYDYSYSQDRDLTVGYGAITAFYFAGPYGFWAGQQYHGDSWVQEVRLSSKDEGPLQWQAGVYYTNKNAVNFQPYYPIYLPTKTVVYSCVSPATCPNHIFIGTETLPVTYQEIAAFANLDYHITPTFDIAAGGRYSHQNQTFQQTGTGLDASASIPRVSMAEAVYTYSADARWHFLPQSMVYARVATGFVPGGPNDEGFFVPVPPTFGPSTTIDYEVGVKSRLFDNHVTVDVDAYEIDWQKIQLIAVVGGYGSITNGGAAKSQGFEWNVTWVPLSGLTLDVNGAYDDAVLTQDAPASVGGHKGDRLPITPLWQSSASANYERPLFGEVSGFAGINWRYSGSRYGEFEPSSSRQVIPSFQIVDLRLGIETSRWTVAAFMKNVGNALAINYLSDENPFIGSAGPESAFVSTPRTVGFEITAKY